MASDDIIRVAGTIVEALSGSAFRVRLINGYVLVAHLSRRQRERARELKTGREVPLELSAYDLSRGRIALPAPDLTVKDP